MSLERFSQVNRNADVLAVYERKVCAGVKFFALVQGQAAAKAYRVMHLTVEEFAKVGGRLQGFAKDDSCESPEERTAEFKLPNEGLRVAPDAGFYAAESLGAVRAGEPVERNVVTAALPCVKSCCKRCFSEERCVKSCVNSFGVVAEIATVKDFFEACVVTFGGPVGIVRFLCDEQVTAANKVAVAVVLGYIAFKFVVADFAFGHDSIAERNVVRNPEIHFEGEPPVNEGALVFVNAFKVAACAAFKKRVLPFVQIQLGWNVQVVVKQPHVRGVLELELPARCSACDKVHRRNVFAILERLEEQNEYGAILNFGFFCVSTKGQYRESLKAIFGMSANG